MAIALGVLLGCAKPLTVYDAEGLIQSWYPQKSETYAITFVEGVSNYSVNPQQLMQLNELKKKGLIEYDIQDIRAGNTTRRTLEIKVTEQGKPYIENDASNPGSKKIYLVVEQFDQVTNISQQDKLATVEYTTLYEPAEPFTQEEVERIAPGCLDEKMDYKISLIKSDSGWKQVPVF